MRKRVLRGARFRTVLAQPNSLCAKLCSECRRGTVRASHPLVPSTAGRTVPHESVKTQPAVALPAQPTAAGSVPITTLLVVEDEASIREMLAVIMEMVGYRVGDPARDDLRQSAR
jgi:hypothetical protein